MAFTAFPHFPLRKGRTHETCGAGALFFTTAVAAQLSGPILWVCEGWKSDHINPAGFSRFFDPHRLILSHSKDQTEMLAVAEEALRSGAVALVIIELSKPLSFLSGRRLQLAAEVGQTTGICMIPKGMGSNSAETRWHCAPVFDGAHSGPRSGPRSGARDSTLQRWEIIKNKTGTLATWDVEWDAEAHCVIVVSKAPQRPGSARARP